MRVEIGEHVEEEPVPDGISIRPYRDVDERDLYELHEASFADHWGMRPTSFENFNEELHGVDWDPSLVFLAESDGRPVGFLAGFLFEAMGYVGILGVLKEARGRGIGKALLRRSFAEFAARGRREVRLGVDAENADGAVKLYEHVGMSVLRAYDAFDLRTEEAGDLAPAHTSTTGGPNSGHR
jgi:ribosomal protein S18 acetylase RimI-like enzyme